MKKYYYYEVITLPNPTREGIHGTRKVSYKIAFNQILIEQGNKGFKLKELIPSLENPDWMVGVFEQENQLSDGAQLITG